MPSLNPLKASYSLIKLMRLLNSPLQIKSFLIPQSPNLFLKAVLYHHMLFIASQVLASSYWYGATELEAFEMLNSKVLNAKLYTIELGYWEFTWEIKHRFKHFQALYQEVLLVKALLKPPLSNPDGRTANLLTFCHSCMQHTEPTPAQRHRLVQKSHETLSKQRIKLTLMKWSDCWTRFHLSSVQVLVSQLRILHFSSLSFLSVQQLGKKTECSRRKWKFIYITRPLKDFKTQLPAKWNQAQCEATFGVLGIKENKQNSGCNHFISYMNINISMDTQFMNCRDILLAVNQLWHYYLWHFHTGKISSEPKMKSKDSNIQF